MPDELSEAAAEIPDGPPPRASAGAGRWTPPSPEHLQRLLPQYEVIGMLGHGGMGAVYKARQLSLDRLVAIKILPPAIVGAAGSNFVERFINEARTMAKMNHPGIVSVYDFGQTAEGQLYLVMEFIDGTDVAKMVKSQGLLPPDYALAITAHVCDALQYAHTHGVIHRDIKPANVLINMEGQVKVADFGLAKAKDSAPTTALTGTGMTMGTPDYIAPESLLMGVEADHRADLYALGVMLYNMLTGEIPRGRFRPASEKVGSDPRFDAIINKAMESERMERYQTALNVRRDLDVILTTPVVKAGDAHSSSAIPKHYAQRNIARKPVAQVPRAANVPPPSPKKSGAIWGVLFLALLGAGGFIAWQKFGKQQTEPEQTHAGNAKAPAPDHASPSASTTKPANLEPEFVPLFDAN
ncbi:MAG TPA: serine/threonine-protein kinase, partial [Verrucomicrobiaceae bacterium]